jgi:hypothetical protein
VLNSDRAYLELETIVLEQDSVVVAGLRMKDLAEIQIHWRVSGPRRRIKGEHALSKRGLGLVQMAHSTRG